MALLQGYKPAYKSLGVVGPASGLAGFLVTHLVAVLQSVPPSQYAVWASVLWGTVTGIYGRWKATKKIGPVVVVALALMVAMAPPVASAAPWPHGDLVLVQGAVAVPDEVPAADEPTDVVPPTENQTVVIEWGNWVDVLLKPIRDAALTLIPLIAIWLMSQLPAALRLFVPAKRVNDMLAHAINAGFNSVSTKVKGKVYTATIMNDWLRSSAAYAIAQAPQMVNEVAATLPLLLQKLIARIPAEMVPPGYTLEEALRGVTPASVKAKAKAQELPPDPFNAYFGK